MIDGDSPQGVRLQERVEKDSSDDNSDEVPELRPVILVKIFILLQIHFEEEEH